jgi:hypothetical protein
MPRCRWDSPACGLQFTFEFLETPCGLLGGAPSPDCRKVHFLGQGNQDSRVQALPVVPEIERREPVATGVRRRKCSNRSTPNPDGHRRNLQIPADRKRASRKRHKKVGLGVHVAVALAFKPDAAHRVVERLLSRRRLNDQVEILRLILPAGVDRRASTSGEHRSDLRLFESPGHRRGDVFQARRGCNAQRGFAVRRGRLLSVLVSLSSSGSCAMSRFRRSSSSLAAKYVGFNRKTRVRPRLRAATRPSRSSLASALWIEKRGIPSKRASSRG